MKIKIDTDELVKKSVISQQTADEILHYYDQSKYNLNSRFALSIVASIFVLAGIAIFAYDYWPHMGIDIKILFSLVPILVGSAVSYWALSVSPDQRFLKEGAAILQCVAIFITLMMVKFIFHIDVSDRYVILFCVMVSFPFVIIFRGIIAATGLMAIASWAISAAIDHHQIFTVSTFFVVMIMILDVIFWYLIYYKGKETFLLEIRLLSAPFVVTIFFIWFLSDLDKHSSVAVSMVAMVIASYTFIFNGWNRRYKWVEADAKWLHLAGFILIVFPILGMMVGNNNHGIYGNALLYLVPFLPIPLLGYFQNREKFGMDLPQITSVSITIIFLILQSIRWKDGGTVSSFAILFFICLLIVHTYWSIKEQYILVFNVVMVFWIIGGLVLMVYDASNYETIKPYIAVIVIAWGLLLFGLNYFIIRKKKSHELQENK